MKKENLEKKYNSLKGKVFEGEIKSNLIEPIYLTHRFTNWFEKLSDTKQMFFYHGFFVSFLLDTISLPVVFAVNLTKTISVGIQNSVNKKRIKKLKVFEEKLDLKDSIGRNLTQEEENTLSQKSYMSINNQLNISSTQKNVKNEEHTL